VHLRQEGVLGILAVAVRQRADHEPVLLLHSIQQRDQGAKGLG
jgi:hypothetical protein